MCESLAVRTERWREKVKGRMELFKAIKTQLEDAKDKIKDIKCLEKAEVMTKRLHNFWKIFEGTCLDMEQEKIK